MEIRKSKYIHDFYNGIIEGDGVQSYGKVYKDIAFAYENKDEKISCDTEMYKVYHFDEGGENALLWGLTLLHPILVNGECNFTRGHFHSDRTEPEIYFGLGGDGLLLYMDDNNECFAEEVFKGSVHYINGKYAHRLINTGDVDLKVGACWRKVAGHDYVSTDKNIFPKRIYKIDGEIKIK